MKNKPSNWMLYEHYAHKNVCRLRKTNIISLTHYPDKPGDPCV